MSFFDQRSGPRTKGTRGFGFLGGAVAFGAALFGFSPDTGGQTHDGVVLMEADLLADAQGIVPGRPFTVGLHLKMAEGWHTYWENPGDSGLPAELDWDLPEGFRVTDFQWPLPLRVKEPGDIEVYAYKDEVLLLARLFPPRNLDEDEVTIGGNASWLVCEDICLPGSAEVSLTLPVVEDSPAPANEELFSEFRERLPAAYRAEENGPFVVEWERAGEDLLLTISGADGEHFDFFPLPDGDLVVGHPEVVERNGAEGETTIRVPVRGDNGALERLDGVVAELDGPQGEPIRGWRLRN